MNWTLPPSDTYFKPVLDITPEGFELDHLHYALKFCKNFRLAVDGGAHVGTWTVELTKYFQSVVAFEPAPDTYTCLLKNIKDLGLEHCVAAINVALSDHGSTCAIVDDPTRPGNTGARVITDIGAARGVNACCTTLDSYSLEKVDFLKLDVEGHELLALRGAVETIRKWKPTILVECKAFKPPRHGGPGEVISYLRNDLGYSYAGGIKNDQVFVHE